MKAKNVTPTETFDQKEKRVRQRIIRKYTNRVGCFRYYLELKKEFPEAVAYYDGNHVRTLINGRFYDRSGMCMFPMKEEARVYTEAHGWCDIHQGYDTVEDEIKAMNERLEALETVLFNQGEKS